MFFPIFSPKYNRLKLTNVKNPNSFTENLKTYFSELYFKNKDFLLQK